LYWHTLTVTKQIWGLADTENRGFLQQEDFAKALRLIGHYQAQPGRPLDPELALSRSFIPESIFSGFLVD
jgi:hypothetical protein